MLPLVARRDEVPTAAARSCPKRSDAASSAANAARSAYSRQLPYPLDLTLTTETTERTEKVI
jgi:hypothetical protein